MSLALNFSLFRFFSLSRYIRLSHLRVALFIRLVVVEEVLLPWLQRRALGT
ncbi:hypothetical protein F383_22427 [Gossypium arboreum]|uniref:Uncharacterized protein n=1 Tax=Gossypium arboreum TaxID=29729 RepID=A0A0B0NXJ9_GOSAR|nr:hypothetical protein F383_22427 [Gossypium arboreum]